MEQKETIEPEKYGSKITKRQLSPEQKRERGRSMIALMIKRFAQKNNLPDPFPITPEEKEKYELYKKRLIAKDEELEYWDNYVLNNKWIQEYLDPAELKEIIEGKADKSNWSKKQWTAYFMSVVLKIMAEEKKKEESEEEK